MSDCSGLREVSLSSKGLRNVGEFDEDKFIFVVGDVEYEVSRFQACFFSGTVRRLVSSDVTANRLIVHIDGCDSSMFDDVVSLMNGDCVSVGSANHEFLERVCLFLDNREIFDVVFNWSVSHEELSASNVVGRLERKKAIGTGISEEIRFLALNFHELVGVLGSVCDDDIDAVLGSDSLRLVDEESLLSFVISRGRADSHSLRFLGHVRPEFLPEDRISEYLHYAKSSGLWDVWCVISDCIRHCASSFRGQRRSVYPSRYLESCEERTAREEHEREEREREEREREERERKERKRKERKRIEQEKRKYGMQDEATKYKGRPLDGIIGHLRSKCTGNVHGNGVVNVTVSSHGYGSLENVMTKGWNGRWNSSSQTEVGSWIMFDFKEKSVMVTYYTVRSHISGTPIACPKTWELVGSNDGNSWISLDTRDDPVLSDTQCHSFSCQSKDQSFRFLRLRQTRNGNGNGYLCLSEFECFGTIRPRQ